MDVYRESTQSWREPLLDLKARGLFVPPKLAFYDFPAEHWKHIRTTNSIESSFATVRHLTKRSKGCLSRETTLITAYKLIKTAEKTWRRLDGKNQLPKVITGVKFYDGYEVIVDDAIAA